MSAKVFACICVTIFYTLYGSGLQAQGGGGDVEQPQYSGPKPIKCHSTEKEMNDSNEVL